MLAEREGVEVEVIDLRTLVAVGPATSWPRASARTGRLLVVHEDVLTARVRRRGGGVGRRALLRRPRRPGAPGRRRSTPTWPTSRRSRRRSSPRSTTSSPRPGIWPPSSGRRRPARPPREKWADLPRRSSAFRPIMPIERVRVWRVEDLRRVIGDRANRADMGAVDHEDPTGNDAVAAPRDLEAEAELLRRARRFVGQGVLPRAGGATAVRDAEGIEVVDRIGRLDGGSIEGRLGSGLVSRRTAGAPAGRAPRTTPAPRARRARRAARAGPKRARRSIRMERLGTIDAVDEDDLSAPRHPVVDPGHPERAAAPEPADRGRRPPGRGHRGRARAARGARPVRRSGGGVPLAERSGDLDERGVRRPHARSTTSRTGLSAIAPRCG